MMMAYVFLCFVGSDSTTMVSCLHILAHTLDTRLVQILVLTLKIKGDQFSHFQVYVFFHLLVTFCTITCTFKTNGKYQNTSFHFDYKT